MCLCLCWDVRAVLRGFEWVAMRFIGGLEWKAPSALESQWYFGLKIWLGSLLQCKSPACSSTRDKHDQIVLKMNGTSELIFKRSRTRTDRWRSQQLSVALRARVKAQSSHPGRFLNVSALHWVVCRGNGPFHSSQLATGIKPARLCRPFRGAPVSVRNRWRNQHTQVNSKSKLTPFTFLMRIPGPTVHDSSVLERKV